MVKLEFMGQEQLVKQQQVMQQLQQEQVIKVQPGLLLEHLI